MKRKLLLAIVALMCSIGTWATDYTSSLPANGKNWSGFTASGPWKGNENITLTGPKGQCSELSDYKFAEVYYDKNTGTVFEISETLTVPNGTYVFQIAAFGRRANVFTEDADLATGIKGEVFAGDATVAVTSNTFVYYTVTTTVTTGSLKVGLRAKDGNLPNWWGYTDATLVRVDDGSADLTRLIVNPTATSAIDGWTASTSDAHRNDKTGFDGAKGFFELCTWGAAWDLNLSQTINNLPNGYYKVKAAGQLSASDTYMKMSANGYESYFNPNDVTNGNILADGTVTTIGSGVAGWRYNEVVCKVTNGSLAIVVQGAATVEKRWANFDNVTLTYLGSEATSASPMDVTGILKNASVDNGYTGWTVTGSGTFAQKIGTTNQGRGYEFYHGSRDLSQALSSLANGKYQVSVQAAWRDAQTTQLYATTASGTTNATVSQAVTTNDPETQVANMYGDASWGKITVDANVTDGNLTVGIKEPSDGAWTVFDNFRLLYYGPTIGGDAEALPDGGAMEAGKWYYFDIALDGDYNLTAGTLDNIVYSTDGTTLVEVGSETKFSSSNPVNLTAGRYYVMSSSANTFEVVAYTPTYTLGSVTAQNIADEGYVKSLSTLVLTFGDAITNDGTAALAVIGESTASLKKNGSEIATGTLTADATAKTLTATFSDVELVLNSTDYSIDIPAGVFGYEGQSVNEAITVNFNTPIFADGDFYIKNKGNNAYFAGGNYWGTQAITNSIGRKVTLTAQSDGTYTVNTYLYNGGTSSVNHFLNGLWCDGVSTGWTFVKDGDYYTISNGEASYLTAGEVGATMTLGASAEPDAAKWSLLTAEAWKAEQVARLDDATSENGVAATFYLASPNFNRNDDLENNKWKGSPGIAGLDGNNVVCNYNAQKYNASSFDVYQEVTGLKPGLYKVTVQGFYRNGTTDDRNAILYANSASVNLVNIRSAAVTGENTDKGFTTANGDYYVPNTQTDASKAFNNNYYNNELEFAVGSDGALRLGVKKSVAASSDWAVFDNFQLTYYGAIEASSYAELTEAYNTAASNLGFEAGEYAPYNNVANCQTLATVKAGIDNQSLTPSQASSMVSTIGGLSWTANEERVNALYDPDFSIQKTKNDGNSGTAVLGWDKVNGLRTIATSTVENSPLYNKYGIYVWGNTAVTYGNTDGYTLPLGAHKIYRASYTRMSWSGTSNTHGEVTVKNSNGENVAFLAEDGNAGGYNTADAQAIRKTIYFATGDEADNYTFILYPYGNAVFTDLELISVDALPLSPSLTYMSGTYPAVTLDGRTFSSSKWNTLCAPFAIPTSAFDEIKVLDAITVNGDNVSMSFADASETVAAGTPCLVKPTDDDYTLTVTNVALDPAQTAGTTTKESGTTSVNFVGTFAGTSLTSSNTDAWVVSNNNLYNVNSNVTVGAYRAYFTVETTSPVKALFFDFEGGADAIKNVETDNMKDATIFNLAGQRVNKAQKGIYIVNGKKVLVK